MELSAVNGDEKLEPCQEDSKDDFGHFSYTNLQTTDRRMSKILFFSFGHACNVRIHAYTNVFIATPTLARRFFVICLHMSSIHGNFPEVWSL